MADTNHAPHNRGHELWTAELGPTRLLLSSIDRWVGAVLADDGVDMPFMGGQNQVHATIIARADGLIAGVAAVDHLIQIWAPSLKISWFAGDGKWVSSGDEIASVSGDRDTMLGVERSILNILGQLSGIASETKRWTSIAPGQIACTRKTVWGLLDKWAVHLGGGLTHRLHQHDATMIKENHLASMYAEHDSNETRIVAYLQDVDTATCGAFLEIEVRDEKEAIMAAAAWAQRSEEGVPKLIIMLDNFGPERCQGVSQQLTEMSLRDNVILEASGGILLEDLDTWHECGIDVLSTSSVNRGATPLDISMMFDGA
tara:strand:- start:6433 stop:7374 length:942 start_codon:yes stop_codon:yes gene_type:complete